MLPCCLHHRPPLATRAHHHRSSLRRLPLPQDRHPQRTPVRFTHQIGCLTVTGTRRDPRVAPPQCHPCCSVAIPCILASTGTHRASSARCVYLPPPVDGLTRAVWVVASVCSLLLCLPPSCLPRMGGMSGLRVRTHCQGEEPHILCPWMPPPSSRKRAAPPRQRKTQQLLAPPTPWGSVWCVALQPLLPVNSAPICTPRGWCCSPRPSVETLSTSKFTSSPMQACHPVVSKDPELLMISTLFLARSLSIPFPILS